MLSLTATAVDAVRDATSAEDAPPEAGLRIVAEEVDGDLELGISLVEAPAEGDEVVEQDGARVYLDPAAAAALAEVELDAEAHGDHFHFAFNERS
jgi:Fe-S cluster assembly iron-binding protein IscA